VNRSSLLRLALTSWCVLGAGGTAVLADNWPGWRGPEHTGVSKETALPTTWSETKNIAWKLPMPGLGGGTPAVWGDRLFVTSSDGPDLVLLCINTAGKELWRRQVGKVGKASIKYDEGNEASPSPSTDGKYVWAMCGTGDFACFDFDGKEIWKYNIQQRYGKYQIQHGIHTTPLLYEDRLYLALQHAKGHWLIAVDKTTGNDMWKFERKTDAIGESLEAYTSPCLWRNGKDAYIVVNGSDYATAHSLKDGSEIWRLGDLNPKSKYQTSFRIIASPTASADVIVVPTARAQLMVAIKPDAKGMITANSAAELWRRPKGSPDVTTPLIHDGLLYVCSDQTKFLACWDAKTGKEFYNERLPDSRYRASLVLGDGKLYVTGRDNGTFLVVKAGQKYELLATNKLNDFFTASPAIADGRLYLRGFKSLYAIEQAGK
jgi:outer membrane protein assembly factor BamB